MTDPLSIISVLANLSDEWRNPREAVISPLSDIDGEPAYQRAIAEGREVRWVAARNVRRRHRDGWRPLVERDRLARPTIFVDANEEMLAMVRTLEPEK